MRSFRHHQARQMMWKLCKTNSSKWNWSPLNYEIKSRHLKMSKNWCRKLVASVGLSNGVSGLRW